MFLFFVTIVVVDSGLVVVVAAATATFVDLREITYFFREIWGKQSSFRKDHSLIISSYINQSKKQTKTAVYPNPPTIIEVYPCAPFVEFSNQGLTDKN